MFPALKTEILFYEKAFLCVIKSHWRKKGERRGHLAPRTCFSESKMVYIHITIVNTMFCCSFWSFRSILDGWHRGILESTSRRDKNLDTMSTMIMQLPCCSSHIFLFYFILYVVFSEGSVAHLCFLSGGSRLTLI